MPYVRLKGFLILRRRYDKDISERPHDTRDSGCSMHSQATTVLALSNWLRYAAVKDIYKTHSFRRNALSPVSICLSHSILPTQTRRPLRSPLFRPNRARLRLYLVLSMLIDTVYGLTFKAGSKRLSESLTRPLPKEPRSSVSQKSLFLVNNIPVLIFENESLINVPKAIPGLHGLTISSTLKLYSRSIKQTRCLFTPQKWIKSERPSKKLMLI